MHRPARRVRDGYGGGLVGSSRPGCATNFSWWLAGTKPCFFRNNSDQPALAGLAVAPV